MAAKGGARGDRDRPGARSVVKPHSLGYLEGGPQLQSEPGILRDPDFDDIMPRLIDDADVGDPIAVDSNRC
jgi:hypothetical protein